MAILVPHWPNTSFLTHSFNFLYTPILLTVLYCTRSLQKSGLPWSTLCIIAFFPIPYTRYVVSHHVKACANMSCFEIALTTQHTLQNIDMIQCCVFWIVRPDLEPILNTLWVEKEKHQNICILSIRVVDFVKCDETAASTISRSASPLACTTLHPCWHDLSEINIIKPSLFEVLFKNWSFVPVNKRSALTSTILGISFRLRRW